jgi:hypothetical protein
MNTMNASAQELAFAPISTVAETVRKKELSPVELVRASLARIDALDSKLNSFYTLFRDDVMAAARVAEAEIAHGQYRGPLHGIPIGIKDLRVRPHYLRLEIAQGLCRGRGLYGGAQAQAVRSARGGQKCDLRIRLRLSGHQVLLQAGAQSMEPGL